MALARDYAKRSSPPKARREDILAALAALLGFAAWALVAVLLA